MAGGLPAIGEGRPLIYVSGAGAGTDGGDWVSDRRGLDEAYLETPPPAAPAPPPPEAPVPTPPEPEIAPIETAPIETAPIETVPIETAPVETAPIEVPPGSTAPDREAEPSRPDPAGEAQPSRAPDPDYLVGPGDALRVEVFEDPSLSGDFTVTTDGSLVFPLLGEVKIRDRTASQIQKLLTDLLEKDYLYDPHVSVTVTAFRSKKVQIQGMVRMPGIYYLEGTARLFDLLSRAQGLLQASGEIRASQVARIVRSQSGETITVDLHELLVLGQDELNLELNDGDVVYVLRTEEIHVIGEVKKPGTYPYEAGMTVLKALSLAGGATKKGSVKNAVVRRIQDGQEVQVKVSVEDLLQPEDILEISLSSW